MHLSLLRALSRRLHSFVRARGGNVSLLFGASLVPLIGLAGLGTDYGIAFSAKAKLDNAADAAAVGAVATAKAYVAAHQTDLLATTKAIAAGKDRASRTFAINAGTVSFAQVPTPTVTLVRTGQTLTANVSYTTTTAAQFGQIFGQSTLNVSGGAQASADIPSYLDFYLLVDVSGSMGLPSTDAGQQKLNSLNGGCQFACHFPASAGGGDGFSIATKGQKNDGTVVSTTSIQLRSGAVNNAVCQLLIQAASPAVPKEYRVGFYPFINQMATMSALTTDIASLQKSADCLSKIPMAFTNMLDTNTTQLYTNGDPRKGTGSGGTHFQNVFPAVQTVIQSFGDGSTALTPKPFVFLITDGMDNEQNYAVPSGSDELYVGTPNTQFKSYTSSDAWFDGSKPTTFDLSYCQNLRNSGVTLSILYIPYVPMTVGSMNQDETNQVNNLIPQLPDRLKSCASTGFFYQAYTPEDITNALNAMFAQAVQMAHLDK